MSANEGLALVGLFVHPITYASVYRVSETKIGPLTGCGWEPDKSDKADKADMQPNQLL